ncbi:MAG: hypothetical protein IT303_12755 [Dehalococcoidia bacterium]|nr:hypothetical protein [Dehalococcoidia bacterium]
MLPYPGLPVLEGGPAIARPPRDATFLSEGHRLIKKNLAIQTPLLADKSRVAWMSGRHFLVAGGTGPGLGAAYVTALLASGLPASVTVVSRDLRQSVGHATGELFLKLTEELGRKVKFSWTNDGLSFEGPAFEGLVAMLRDARAADVVYLNTVAAANSGVLPGMPDVYTKDINDSGELFQWKLPVLTDKQVTATRFIMGDLAVALPVALRKLGIDVSCEVYADWRGSLDRDSRDPDSIHYARQGAYSTSLYLPKDVVHSAVAEHYGTSSRRMVDIFFPVMNTRALPLIPGGRLMNGLISGLLERAKVRQKSVAELAVNALYVIGDAINDRLSNPFPRLDDYELPIDLWALELQRLVSADPTDPFYVRRWLSSGSD